MSCAACGKRAYEAHHVVYQRELRKYGADPGDEDNWLLLCRRCHEKHHWGGEHRLDLSLLTDANYLFARELLGGPRAYEYLKRRYNGSDPRLDALLRTAQATHDAPQTPQEAA